MCRLLWPVLLCGVLPITSLAGMCTSWEVWHYAHSIHELSARDIKGSIINLDKHWGFLCIITSVPHNDVNRCK
uniref:Uncharacterized protein n=1 Tax=Ursus maritimus TaxID=29073 RepID=A0A452UAN0_URSMA